MKILQICPRSPIPPNDGGAQGMYYFAEALRQLGHEVVTLAIGDTKDITGSSSYPAFILRVIKPSNLTACAFRAIIHGIPFSVAKYSTPIFLDAVKTAINEEKPDLIWVDHTQLGLIAMKVFGHGKYQIFVRAHNLEWRIFERSANFAQSIPRKLFLKIEAARMKRFEADLAAHVNGIACISVNEAEWFKENTVNSTSYPDRIHYMPAGYSGIVQQLRALSSTTRILHISPLDWRPNSQGLEWFLDQVWPILLRLNPCIEIDIIGRNPSHEIVQRYASPSVRFHGFVEDLIPFEKEAQCFIVPLHVGGGIRIKLLNAFSKGIPVVTTTIGCEGLPIQHGSHAQIADTPRDFAEAVIRCITHDQRIEAMRHKAYYLVTQELSWLKIVNDFINSALISTPKSNIES